MRTRRLGPARGPARGGRRAHGRRAPARGSRLVGGDALINWVKPHYRVPFLGDPPTPSGRWGNTRITPRGVVHLYQELKADPKVGPWLLDAMRKATPYGSDGQFQFFGIPAADGPHHTYGAHLMAALDGMARTLFATERIDRPETPPAPSRPAPHICERR